MAFSYRDFSSHYSVDCEPYIANSITDAKMIHRLTLHPLEEATTQRLNIPFNQKEVVVENMGNFWIIRIGELDGKIDEHFKENLSKKLEKHLGFLYCLTNTTIVLATTHEHAVPVLQDFLANIREVSYDIRSGSITLR